MTHRQSIFRWRLALILIGAVVVVAFAAYMGDGIGL